VLANGSEIIDLKTGRVLARRTLAAETARDVVTRVAGRDSVLGIIVHFERANVADRPAAGDLAEFASRASLRLAPSTTASIEPGDTTGRGPILKLLVVLAKPDTMRADCPCLPVTSTLADRVRDEIARDRADARVVASGPQTVEVVPITKGEAVLTALRSVGIRPSDVIAFGDSGNDLEMLQSVGFGVAMGNCRSGACEAAIARIGAHDTDAIADLVRHVALVDGHIR
jgi:hydroxymethylpyrimidine pyrophosphatase-like HAD family hydrolase